MTACIADRNHGGNDGRSESKDGERPDDDRHDRHSRGATAHSRCTAGTTSCPDETGEEQGGAEPERQEQEDGSLLDPNEHGCGGDQEACETSCDEPSV